MALYFPKPVADSTICVVQVIGDAWDQKVLSILEQIESRRFYIFHHLIIQT